MEKYKTIVKRINLAILLIAPLNIYTWSVYHVVDGGTRFGILTEPFKEFIFFPKTVKEVFEDLSFVGMPRAIVNRDLSFQEINNLDYDVFALNGNYKTEEYEWNIKLSNLRDDVIHHSWSLKEANFYTEKEQFSNSLPVNPILLDNRSLIVLLNNSKNLYRIDSASNIVWHSTIKEYHHAMNLDADNNIWVCTSEKGLNKFMGKTVEYRDDFVTKISTETGDVLFDKSVSDILIENGYVNFVFGYSDTIDPLHINDIEPALSDGEFWNKHDLFISLRHSSLVIQYRPHTNTIVRLIYGQFLYQHDVDISADNQISIFNNNISNTGTPVSMGQISDDLSPKLEFKSSQIVSYNFSDSTFTVPMKNQCERENIFTRTQGLHSFLNNGDVFIESTDEGKIYILNDKEILLRKYMNAPVNDMVEMPYWIRIYEDINF